MRDIKITGGGDSAKRETRHKPVEIVMLEDRQVLAGISGKKKAPGTIPGAQRRLLTKTHQEVTRF